MTRGRPPLPSGELPEDIFSSSANPSVQPASAVVVDPAPPAADPELPAPGTVLDRFRVDGVIGAGAFAVVLRAHHLALDLPVALKLLRPRVVRRSPGLVHSLCAEARLAARINHPNVVRIHDVVQSDDLTFIVMELCEGEPLSQQIARKGHLRATRVLRIGHAVSAGLRAGLAEDVVHRDIKPANVVVMPSGGAKIVDLGLARRITDDVDERGRRAGLVGTPGYMAPEQADAPDRADFRADIYALGVTLYHAAVGAPPFPTGDAERALHLHRTAPIPPPRSRRPEVPEELERLLLWMLAREPAQRPRSYEVLQAALRRALERLASAGPR